LSKEEIFELYVNRVFLGHRAYGFEAASQVYYGQSIGELSLAQHAMLAGIPKAPSRNNPVSGPEAGKARRNWILGRMRDLGFIDTQSHAQAVQAPVSASLHGAQVSFYAPYVAEMARRRMLSRYGIGAYTAGYRVFTTIDARLQRVAQQAVIDGIRTYDRRHGYRGPEQQFPPTEDTEPPWERWREVLAETPPIAGLSPAIVTAVDDEGVSILLPDERSGRIAWENGIRSARPYVSEDVRGPAPASPGEVLAVGDLIRTTQDDAAQWHLDQIPAAQAALVSLDPGDGAILSLVGGIGFDISKFNRATQAQRQPGSNLKPFLYAAALDAGFTAASIINDAPVVVDDASLEGVWRPVNDSGKFYGPTRLRWALTKSRNLVSIRLLQELGVRRFIDYATRLGFDTSDFAPDLSLALGSHAMSPLELAAGYAILANGGYRIEPYLIERVEGLDGTPLFNAEPARACAGCEAPAAGDELSMEEILDAGQESPGAPRVMDERVQFIIDDILRDVITRGTGRRALTLGREDLAGKTGTTNGPMDAWFSGYTPDVVTTTWVGFDDYTPLGQREFGGTAALPVWIDFMREALRDKPARARRLPAGISHVRIDPATGLLAQAGQRDAIFEYFRVENVPTESAGDAASGRQGTDDLIQEIF
jgi:penicillin-binding protein 1A